MYLLILLIAVVLCSLGFFLTYYFCYQKPKNKFLEREKDYLKGRMGANRKEYALQGKCKKVILSTNKLYIRTEDMLLGTFYDCADILDATVEYRVNNEVVHYENKYGAIEAGIQSGFLNAFGIGTIVDLDSFTQGENVLEKRLAICIVISMKKETLVLLAFNEIINNNTSISGVKEIARFIEDLREVIKVNNLK